MVSNHPALMRDELGRAVDALTDAIRPMLPEDKQHLAGPFSEALGNLLAVALNRAAATNGVVLGVLDQRVSALEARQVGNAER